MRIDRAAPAVATVAALLASGAGAPAPASAQVMPHPREMGPPAPADPRPDPGRHRVELANGTVAYLAVDRTVPLVTLTAFVGAGWVDGAPGAAEAWARMLRSGGPAGMTPESFQDRLDAMAADFRVAVDAERIEIRLDVPAEDAPEAVEMLGGMLVRGPDLDAGVVRAVAAAGERRAGGGAASERDPDAPPAYEGSLASAAALLRLHLLDGTRYEGPTAGAGGLGLADVEAFHRAFLVTGNVVVAAAGDFDRGAMRAELGRALASLGRGGRHQRAATPTPRIPDDRTLRLYPVDKLQGWWALGTVLPPVPREDEAALQVMNYILGGGHFDTRLFREARDARGLTNDDSGFLEPRRDGPGVYWFGTYGRPEVVRLLLDLTLREAERIRREPVTEEELFVAKGALADGPFAARYRDGWSTARTLAEEWLEEGDHDASATWQARVRAVTRDDVLAAARRYLRPDGWTGVLVGPIEAVRVSPPLEGEGRLEDYGRVVGPGR